MKKISLFIVSMVLSFICINKIYTKNNTDATRIWALVTATKLRRSMFSRGIRQNMMPSATKNANTNSMLLRVGTVCSETGIQNDIMPAIVISTNERTANFNGCHNIHDNIGLVFTGFIFFPFV